MGEQAAEEARFAARNILSDAWNNVVMVNVH